jgi:hypothetical protein
MGFVNRSARPVRASRSPQSVPAPRATIEEFETRLLFSTYTVTTTADAGAGSLRDALAKANATSAADVINFQIGTGLQTIAPLSGLPAAKYPVTIDATTQGGYAGKPLIELRGDAAGTGANGLVLVGGATTVKGLVINRFASNGVLMMTNGGNTLAGNYIGLDATGTLAAPNGQKGVILQCAGNTVGGLAPADRNVIAGNGSHGMQLYTTAAANNKILGNYIGTNAAGAAAVPNGGCGITVAGGSNVIGGAVAGARNVISGNKADGVLVAGSGATNNALQGNYVGTNAAGSAKLGNGSYGVEISQPYNTVGGAVAGAGNVISGNGSSGVVLWLTSANNCRVSGNFIGTDRTGALALGNVGSGVDVSNGASYNTVGGPTAAERNVIAANARHGVMVYQGTDNLIQNNTIGLNAARTAGLGNLRNGVHLTETTRVTIASNTIGYNTGYAISKTSTSTAITLSLNTITNDTLYGV